MIQFRLVLHPLLLDFSRNSSSCSYSCIRIKQSRSLVIRLSLEFDNRYQIYCDTMQLFNASRTFIVTQRLWEGIKTTKNWEILHKRKKYSQNQYKNVNCTDINHFSFLLQKVFVRSKLPTNFTGVSKFACHVIHVKCIYNINCAYNTLLESIIRIDGYILHFSWPHISYIKTNG